MTGGARGNLESIKSDYRALGVTVRGMTAQVVFSSVLLERGKGVKRMELILHVNNWLHSWCQKQDFGFYDHGTMFQDQCLLGIHTTK